MAGLFGGGLGRQGLFGSWQGPNMPLLAASLGMLSGNNNQQGFQNALAGWQAGSEFQDRRDSKKKQRQQEEAYQRALQSGALGQQSPAMQELLANDPELMRSVAAQQLQPAEKQWNRLDGDTLFDPRSGETRNVGTEGPTSGVFGGNSVEAQSLNYLVNTGKLSPEQAAQLGAGKTITGPNGEVIFMTPEGLMSQPGPGGQQSGATALTGPKLTEDMKKVGGFAERAAASDQIISDPAVAAAGASLGNNMASGLPGGNYMVSDEYQQFDQAQRDFINAMLRRESGAAIAESEFDNARKQYFPQPGDSPRVIQQKAENRRRAIAALEQSASPSPTFGGGQGDWTDLGNGVRARVLP